VAKIEADRAWRIEGYDGDQRIFDRTIPVGMISDSELKVLMQRLACRHLSDAEIVAASLRRNSEGYSPLLELSVTSAPGQHVICSGDNPHYIASIGDRH
jgi:hypothetical protein